MAEIFSATENSFVGINETSFPSIELYNAFN